MHPRSHFDPSSLAALAVEPGNAREARRGGEPGAREGSILLFEITTLVHELLVLTVGNFIFVDLNQVYLLLDVSLFIS